MVDGPDGVAVTLTPGAAEETGHRLIANASDAARRETPVDGEQDQQADGRP